MKTFITLLLSFLLSATLFTTPAQGANLKWSGTLRVPGHGTCDARQLVGNNFARVSCRDGWKRTYIPCQSESTRNCFWDGKVRGNKRGATYVDVNGIICIVTRDLKA